MKLTLKVTELDGNVYEVQTNLFTIVALERKFKIKASDLAQGVGLEHLAFLAYESCKLVSIAVPPMFDAYIQKLESVEVVDNEPANPTNGEVTADN